MLCFRSIIWAVLGLSCVALLAACGGSSESEGAGETDAAAAGPLPVVASFSVVADWVEAIGGERVEVTTAVPRGSDPHAYEPTARQVAQIRQAGAIFLIGASMEPGLESSLDLHDHRITVLSRSVDLLSGDHHDDHHGHDNHGHDDHDDHDDHGHDDHGHDDHGHDDHGHDDHGHDDHGHHDHSHDYDPHIWTSVVTARQAVRAIRDALIEADPAGGEYYTQRFVAYDADLEELHQWIIEQVSQVPEERRVLVTTHDILGYFIRDYGFRSVGTVLGTVSTDVADPSARHLAELAQAMRDAAVPVVFPESTTDNRLLAAVAREAGVPLAEPLVVDSLGPEGSENATYIGQMRQLTRSIVQALSAE